MGNKNSQTKQAPTSAWGDISIPYKPTTTLAPLVPSTIERPKYPQPSFSAVESRVPAIVQTATYSTPSWDIWRRHVLEVNIHTKDLHKFDSRISYNADTIFKKYEDRAREIQLQRARAETELLTNKDSPKPALSLNSCFDQSQRYAKQKVFDKKYFSPKPERPELTNEMLVIIEDASKPYPATEVLVQIDGVDLTRKDIHTLTGLNWLNDEVINAYLYLIVSRGKESNRKKVYAYNTFFYPKLKEAGYNSIKRWTRKVDIFSHDFLLVPIHLGNHWCLAFIDFLNRIISYYDSLGGGTNNCCDTLLDYLRYESNDKKKQDFDDENWQLINCYSDIGIPQQKNGSDCGVFACIYAEYLSRQAKLNFTQEHMSYFRKKMIYELKTKRILE